MRLSNGAAAAGTDVYDKIKQMNAEIQALSGVFLGCEVVSVRPYGRVDSPRNRSADRAPCRSEEARDDGCGGCRVRIAQRG